MAWPFSPVRSLVVLLVMAGTAIGNWQTVPIACGCIQGSANRSTALPPCCCSVSRAPSKPAGCPCCQHGSEGSQLDRSCCAHPVEPIDSESNCDCYSRCRSDFPDPSVPPRPSTDLDEVYSFAVVAGSLAVGCMLKLDDLHGTSCIQKAATVPPPDLVISLSRFTC